MQNQKKEGETKSHQRRKNKRRHENCKPQLESPQHREGRLQADAAIKEEVNVLSYTDSVPPVHLHVLNVGLGDLSCIKINVKPALRMFSLWL